MKLNPQHQLARQLFFQTEKTQKEIAEAVGISDKTLYLWVKHGDWKNIKASARMMPSMITSNIYSQITELNDAIRNREPGNRYATKDEAETIRRLIMSLRDIKQQTTQGENIEMMMSFITYINKTDHDFAKQIVDFAGEYLKGRSVMGFQPYEVEYDAISPYKDEDRKNPQLTGTFTLRSCNKPETDPQSTGNEPETPEIK